MLAVGKPRLPAVLLVWAAALFGAARPMPTGPLGLASSFVPRFVLSFSKERESGPDTPS